MADNSEQSSNMESTVNDATEKLSELPVSTSSDAAAEHAQPGPYRLFNRKRSIRELLGGGKAADVILWRRKSISIGVLVTATAAWLLFEWSGYTLLSLTANVLLFLIAILFLWANAATLLKRPPPPLPELELSEEMVNSTAASMRVRINYALAVAHDIALGKDFKLFLKVVFCLWLFSIVGSWFNFLTLAYISLVILITIPVFYNTYEDHVDRYAEILHKEITKLYKRVDENVISKIPSTLSKEKKKQ